MGENKQVQKVSLESVTRRENMLNNNRESLLTMHLCMKISNSLQLFDETTTSSVYFYMNSWPFIRSPTQYKGN